jgi:hypothetical protein
MQGGQSSIQTCEEIEDAASVAKANAALLHAELIKDKRQKSHAFFTHKISSIKGPIGAKHKSSACSQGISSLKGISTSSRLNPISKANWTAVKIAIVAFEIYCHTFLLSSAEQPALDIGHHGSLCQSPPTLTSYPQKCPHLV